MLGSVAKVYPELVSHITQDELRALLVNCPVEAYPKHSPLFYRQHLAYGAFVLIEGDLEIEFKKERKTISERVSPILMLGRDHVLESKPFNASASTLNPCRLMFVPKGLLQKVPVACGAPSKLTQK